jgi:hypothetical protein
LSLKIPLWRHGKRHIAPLRSAASATVMLQCTLLRDAMARIDLVQSTSPRELSFVVIESRADPDITNF